MFAYSPGIASTKCPISTSLASLTTKALSIQPNTMKLCGKIIWPANGKIGLMCLQYGIYTGKLFDRNTYNTIKKKGKEE